MLKLNFQKKKKLVMKLKLYSSPEEDKKIIFMISSLNFLEPVAYRKKEITRGFVVSNGKFSSIIARPSLSIRDENWNFILVATCQWQLTTWLPRPPHLEANDFIHSIYFCMTKNKYRPLQTLAYMSFMILSSIQLCTFLIAFCKLVS